MDLKGKSVAVIGGAGFIGSHTIDQLLNTKVEKIVIYDNFARGTSKNIEASLRDPRVDLFEAGGDIQQPDILNMALKDIDAVFHFAALWLLQCHEYPRSAFSMCSRLVEKKILRDSSIPLPPLSTEMP